MLTLSPGCACDVCAEEYGPHRMPHSIPCGHVLCASCFKNIVEKSSSRNAPGCPFCREHFTIDSARLIRMDFATSGWSTPRRVPELDTFNNFNSEVLQRKTAQLFNSNGNSKTRIEVRRLEDRVAKVAAKKCSVEEVDSLYKELEEYLVHDKEDLSSSLFLSAALLRAILMNHHAHSEASKATKTAEANLKHKIEQLELNNTKLEAELRRQRSQYTQKSQEAQQLLTQVNQLRALATTLGVTPPEMPAVPSVSPTPSPSPAHISHSLSTSPTPYSSSQSSYTSPLSRFNSMHSRSASMSSRPTTPATPLSPTRSHPPATPTSANPPPRSHTPGPRSHTPGPGHSSASAAAAAIPRSHTPAPTPPRSHTPSLSRTQTPVARPYPPAPVPPMPSLPIRYSTPAPPTMASYRTQTPAPLVPPKPRRLSQPSPPKMMSRSTSEEKPDHHERWLPPNHGIPVVDDSEYSGRKTVRPPSRASFGISQQLYQRV